MNRALFRDEFFRQITCRIACRNFQNRFCTSHARHTCMILYHSRASNVHDLDSLRLNELCKLLVGIAFLLPCTLMSIVIVSTSGKEVWEISLCFPCFNILRNFPEVSRFCLIFYFFQIFPWFSRFFLSAVNPWLVLAPFWIKVLT